MPILERETDLYPSDLLDRRFEETTRASWWALYTRSRMEKELMRRLMAREIAFYSPLIPHRNRSPGGRWRTSYIPLFPSYVFLFGDSEHRHDALTSNCVSRWLEVPDAERFASDLRKIRDLIATGQPITPEAQLAAGAKVRITSGSLMGLEGVVIERKKETRLVVAVDFLQQGASVLLEDCQLERVE